MTFLLAGCCDSYGWMAAFGSMLAFGSFGVPIKSEAAKSVDIDPLVFQTYKTFMCFATCWLVLAFGAPLSYTPWGIISGLFWVPGGVATIAGIKFAGLAVAMGILSSFIVLVSFSWGIFFFDEAIHSRPMACFAVSLMALGLVGMSYYTSLEHGETEESLLQQSPEDSNAEEDGDRDRYLLLEDGEDGDVNSDDPMLAYEQAERQRVSALRPKHGGEEQASATISSSDISDDNNVAPAPSMAQEEQEEAHEENAPRRPLLPQTSDLSMSFSEDETERQSNSSRDHIIICGHPFRKRPIGIACSVFSGVWGGSIMAPEKMAKANTSGVEYLISFAIGASIVTIALWCLRFTHHYMRLQSARRAYQALPSFHLRVMWLPGGTAGLLWSIGNFCSLLSVEFLGEGVGYSLTQSAMLVSGLWGVFFFREVKNTKNILCWFASALVTVSGIVLLSYEHHEK